MILKHIPMNTVIKPLQAALPLLAVLTALLSSCSGDDYVNAVPGNSMALVWILCFMWRMRATAA